MVDEIRAGVLKTKSDDTENEIEEAVRSYRKGITRKSKKTAK